VAGGDGTHHEKPSFVREASVITRVPGGPSRATFNLPAPC
jgi:hypothetical protein